MTKKLAPVHPGEVLREEFLIPFGISPHRLASAIKVSPQRINDIVRGDCSISANTALRFARYFGTSERFWLNLQIHYDLDAERERIGPKSHERSSRS